MVDPPETPEAPDRTEARLPCPACGTKYKWKAELAGRKLKCRCGVLIRMPKEPTGKAKLEHREGTQPPAAPPPPKATAAVVQPAAEDEYDLALPDTDQLVAAAPDKPAPPAGSPAASAKNPGKCSSCGAPINPKAVICLNCGFNLAEGKKLETLVGDDAAAPASKGKAPAALKGKNLNQSSVEGKAEIAPKRKTRSLYLALALLGMGLVILVAYFFLYKKR